MIKKYIRFNEVNNPGKKTRIYEVINLPADYYLKIIHIRTYGQYCIQSWMLRRHLK